jgi:hypothetical protein
MIVSAKGIGRTRLAVFVVWTAAVALVIFALFGEQEFRAAKPLPVATLDKKRGAAWVRTEGDTNWLEVSERHEFIDGDRIASGSKSRLRITFGSGREVTLGEDTQVRLMSIRHETQVIAFIVDLYRGALAAKASGACGQQCPPLVIKSGRKTYNLTKKESIGLYKTAVAEPTRFDIKGPWPEIDQQKRDPLVLDPSFLEEIPTGK